MKKAAISLLLITKLFISCDSNFESKNKSTEVNKLNYQRTSQIFEYVESTYINNGLSSKCENNILIFPSLELYENTIDELDNLVEIHCDNFEQNANQNLTDEGFENLSDELGFDEDLPLRKFEQDLAFCSLWSKIYNEETEWLNNQGDGEWNVSDDPDDHFIDDESERVLLNIGSEVMIGSEKDGYVIYKFYEWGYITVSNNDIEALLSINTTGILPTNNPNVEIINDIKKNNNLNCKKDVVQRKYFSTGSNTRIKTVDKSVDFKGAPGPMKSSKMKSKTKYYRKKIGVWTRGKTTLTAGFEGKYNRLGYFQYWYDCGEVRSLNETKTRKRSKIKIKHKGDSENYFRVEDNQLRGIHKRREDVIKKVDYYDGDVI